MEKVHRVGWKKKRDEFRLGFFGSLLPGVGLVCRRKCCTEFLKKEEKPKGKSSKKESNKSLYWITDELQRKWYSEFSSFTQFLFFWHLKSQKFREYVRASVKRFQFRPMWGGWGIDCVGWCDGYASPEEETEEEEEEKEGRECRSTSWTPTIEGVDDVGKR